MEVDGKLLSSLLRYQTCINIRNYPDAIRPRPSCGAGRGRIPLRTRSSHYARVLNRTRRPIAYASRTLNKHEKSYGQIDKKTLQIMFGLKRFHLYLYGRHFTILTGHKPLERIFGPKTAIPSLAAMRLQRWAIILAAVITALNLYHPSKTQWQMHYHAYLYRRRLGVRAPSSRLKSVW